MKRDELHLARILFKNKVYESDKQSFEDLFIRVLQQANPNFQPVKPQGRYGDRKNDGFDQEAGVFYQVYAPEDLRFKEDEAVEKLDKDFYGVYNHWKGNGFPFNEFYYMVNDKYVGHYPTLINAVFQINQKHNIKCELLRSKHLEDTFLSLSDHQMLDVIGFLPDPAQISDIDFDAMSEVVNHLMRYEMVDSQEKIVDPDFDKKLVLNKLSRPVASFLITGHFQSFVIKDYFELNSDFLKEELRKRFNGLYRDSKKKIPESDTKNDEIFFSIASAASPTKMKAVRDAVYVLMSYYFEFCDIFEPLDNYQQGSLFE